ncbi:S49 family peptidase [Burkholderia territorii]|uniref:S49 family peptidase n=1 Tax=Burkholderia territorii TaxID=1503055 RepID=UPI000AC4C956|nr:S49 family peptidase [Burkholderia territorii]
MVDHDAAGAPGSMNEGNVQLVLQQFMMEVVRDNMRERRSERKWRKIRRGLWAVSIGAGILFTIAQFADSTGFHVVPKEPLIGVVQLEGEIAQGNWASADKVVPALREAYGNKNVKAVVLAVDSGGGAPVESERINFVIDQLRAEKKKPILAVINNVGASAAYMVSMHADKVYAGKYSLVGSIGAIISAWNLSGALEKFDVKQTVYASGALKSMLNPFIPPSPAGEKKAQDMANVMGQTFAREFEKRRSGKLLAGFNYATGEVWNGDEALRLGLIDGIETIESVAKQFGAKPYQFGPRTKSGGLLSSSVGDWVHDIGASIGDYVVGRLQQSAIRVE